MALLVLHLPTLALTAVTTLVYPLYSSYKAVTDSSTTLAEMETWLVYWSVYACWTLLESLLGFTWSWIPFYYELRLAFHIWLVAPQTRGAMWLYVNHLHPFLRDNQGQIDGLIEQAKQQVHGKAQDVLGQLWKASSEAEPSAPQKGARHAPPGSTPAPPTQHNPAQAPLSLLGGLFRQYAPAAIATAKQLFDAPPPGTKPAEPIITAYSIPSSSEEKRTALTRRRELERQLAALDTTTATSSSDDEPVTVLRNKNSRSFGPAAGLGLRNRQQPSSTGATLGRSAGIAGIGAGGRAPGGLLGESYDLLDHDAAPPAHESPQPQGRRTSRGWIPWSPASSPAGAPPGRH